MSKCSLTMAAVAFSLGTGTVLARDYHVAVKDTISVVEMNRNDALVLQLANGSRHRFEVIDTSAEVLFSNLKDRAKMQLGGATIFEMDCTLRADGQIMHLRRYVCTQEAFYVPYVINGVRVWFDAVSAIGRFLTFGHGDCKPRQDVRLAVQDATLRICPDEVLPWYENRDCLIKIADTNDGDDCWMGPFEGLDAHAGLDINQRTGSFNYAPIAFDDQFLFESLAKHDDNNRWRGIRHWKNGDVWSLQTHHVLSLLVPEHQPITAGTPFCTAAGVKYGGHQHSHYVFKVMRAEENAEHVLDPWIVFWQGFEDQKARLGERHAEMLPVGPAVAGRTVSFSAAGSRPGPGRKQLQAYWSFGDGGWAEGWIVSHVFARPGVFPVTVTVSDGAGLAATTQHVTVNGDPVSRPVLGLEGTDIPVFRPRPQSAMDVYGTPIGFIPGSVSFLARQKRPRPDSAEVRLSNLGGGSLRRASVRIVYAGEGKKWLNVPVSGSGNGQVLRVQADASGLGPAMYRARVIATVPAAENGEQSFEVSLLVPSYPALPPVSLRVQMPREKIVDDADPGFYATPWFWLQPGFSRLPKGHGGSYLTNGGRAAPDEYVRYTPDLAAWRYEVRLAAETPYPPGARFAVRIKHAHGDDRVWMEPAKSRVIGSYEFNDGTDGFVEILAAGSSGQVLADAVIFRRL